MLDLGDTAVLLIWFLGNYKMRKVETWCAAPVLYTDEANVFFVWICYWFTFSLAGDFREKVVCVCGIVVFREKITLHWRSFCRQNMSLSLVSGCQKFRSSCMRSILVDFLPTLAIWQECLWGARVFSLTTSISWRSGRIPGCWKWMKFDKKPGY